MVPEHANATERSALREAARKARSVMWSEGTRFGKERLSFVHAALSGDSRSE
jgi:hypothetical protein